MRRFVWTFGGPVVAVLLTQGCARGPAAARKRPNQPPAVVWPSAVERGMKRQVQVAQNAELASTGDTEGDGLRRAVVTQPDNMDARAHLAAYYERTGQPELAIEHYRLALGRQRDAVGPRLELVRLLHTMKLDEQALSAASEGIAEHASRQLISWKGILLDELGRASEGEAAHREALARAEGASPGTLAALHNNLGQNLLLQKQYGAAAAAFQQALAIDRRLETARNNLGMALALSADTERALAHWKSVSGPATAHNNLAAVLIEQDRYPEARRQLNIALGYEPNNEAAMRNLAVLGERDGKPAVLEPEHVRSSSAWARIAQTIKTTFGASEGRAKTDRTQAAQK
ncbi:MAG: tetratricopeptide repeat protein [Acidobacteriota bacterium]